MNPSIDKKAIKNKHLEFASARGEDKTYCPSEVARDLFSPNWRDKMNVVREVADTLVQDGELVVLQKGEIKSDLPSNLKGPIRLKTKK